MELLVEFYGRVLSDRLLSRFPERADAATGADADNGSEDVREVMSRVLARRHDICEPANFSTVVRQAADARRFDVGVL